MAFSMQCVHKGCADHMDPYIDPKEDKVYCSSCNRELTNVTYFTKVQLKNLKQFKPKTVVSFAVKCNNCGKEDRPKVVKDDIVCKSCNKAITNLSQPFKLMLKENLKNVDKDV